jgi:Zn-finger nucleic acid-binding protein
MSFAPRKGPTGPVQESLDCPICKTGLNLIQADDLSLNECPYCKGVWFDINALFDELHTYSHSFEKFRSNWDTEFSEEEFAPDSGRPTRRCPRCETESLVSGRYSDIHVFRCRDCTGAFVFSEVLDKFRPMDPELVSDAMDRGIVGFFQLLVEALRRAGH